MYLVKISVLGALSCPLHCGVMVCDSTGFPVCVLTISSETRRCYVLFVRAVYIFGARVKDPVNDLTPTFLTDRVLATLRSADSVVNKILQESGNFNNSNN